jgi:diphosphomevalonate decarboxylase
MSVAQATAAAGPNIALIKYWGNRDVELRIPASGSISLTLAALEVVTSVTFLEGQRADSLEINGTPATPGAAARVTKLLDVVRQASGLDAAARVDSTSNFPAGAGIASSAAAFAALAGAAVAAAGLQMDDQALSRLARRGSGSACRSVYGGYVEWIPGEDDLHSFAQPLQPPEHWRLIDVIAVVDETPKAVSSTQGHALAPTSPLQNARLEGAPERLRRCRRALEQRDFEALADIVELDSNMMHAVMMTSTPPLHYWQPATLDILHQVSSWRRSDIPVCYTMDAGPTVHCLCEAPYAAEVARRLEEIPGVARVFSCPPGQGVRRVAED